MSWLGKLLGGTFGFLVGGPLGALLGAAIVHKLDGGKDKYAQIESDPSPDAQHRIQMAFFTATFSVMGHVARADGRVSEAEITVARTVMNRMSLSEGMRRTAIELFSRGKQPDFPLREAVEQFRKECHRRYALLRIFLEIQLEAAFADGPVNQAEERVLLDICDRLRISRFEYHAMKGRLDAALRFARAYQNSSYGGHRNTPARRREDTLEDAYAMLGIEASAGADEVKRAYRKLISRHHPDKLVARGMPEEMVRIANEKTQQIRKAYEVIAAARNL
ncbi:MULTISPECIES: co-chaperone DjlA [Methylococcus]|uniref:co-chaperone DjlA n=1 Tax=Methylococcus TaxID=413 RepID=UPI001C52F95F|nr:co-chaperone DjlA [Methylococcus capsulatus]QXP86471.1 co-chaperone DjlA [Methylococcus capsulatus]QXP89311.1 co-chaperone DjlA [Methylococcus capsulatus]QXP93861.1 co-chaperone DjlA [Methylococcus capsulatus]UQN11417.1 co-chaperone DjlA [Methylococcus capsulatus]